MASKPAPKKTPPKATTPTALKKAAGIAVSAKAKAKPKPRAHNADEIKTSICEQIAHGVPLAEIARQPGMPKRQTVHDWMAADEDFAGRFARARDDGADAIAEQTLEIVDQPPERDQTGKIDPGWVAHQKLRAEHRLKLLAKWNPKKYGEKLTQEHTGADGGAIQVASTITFVRPPARSRDDT